MRMRMLGTRESVRARCGALDARARARARCARLQGRCVVARPEVEGDVDVEGLTLALRGGLPPGCDTYEGDMLLADVCRSGLLARRSVSRRDSDTAPPAWATTSLPVHNVRCLGRCLGKGGCCGCRGVRARVGRGCDARLGREREGRGRNQARKAGRRSETRRWVDRLCRLRIPSGS